MIRLLDDHWWPVRNLLVEILSYASSKGKETYMLVGQHRQLHGAQTHV